MAGLAFPSYPDYKWILMFEYDAHLSMTWYLRSGVEWSGVCRVECAPSRWNMKGLFVLGDTTLSNFLPSRDLFERDFVSCRILMTMISFNVFLFDLIVMYC